MTPTINADALNKVIAKIDQCIDWQTFYALEDDLNLIGLSIHTAPNRRMVLCQIKNGKPMTKKVIDNYIFIGSLETSMNEISLQAIEKLKNFVLKAAGKASKIANMPRAWRDGLRMYEATIAIMPESKDREDDGYLLTES